MKLITTAVLLLLSSVLFAQTGDIRGFVFEKATGEPSIFTPVFLKGTTIGVTTDVNGYFTLAKVKVGTYTLVSTSIGFDTATAPVTVVAGGILNQKMFLKKRDRQLKEVVISAEKQTAITEVRTSVQKITAKQIKQLASVGGEPDIAQYLQVLPGVTFTGDQGGQLYIRGGSPVQNKVLLDGMTIYNPFHSIGFFSVFETDIIRNADVYSGGFGAQYGGRVSSIMDITTRDGNKNKHNGKIALSTFGAKLVLEGPLLKPDSNGKGTSITYVVSGKTSYLNATSKTLYNYKFDPNSESKLGIGKLVSNPLGLPFSYTDLYGKLSANLESGSKLNVFGFDFMDAVKYDLAQVGWKNLGGGFNAVLVPQGTNVLIKTRFNYSKYAINYVQKGIIAPRTSSVGGFNGGMDFVHGLEHGELGYGLEITNTVTTFKFTNALKRTIENDNASFETALYLKYRYNSKNTKLVIDPSIRLQYYATLGEFSPEPRLGVKYNVSNKFRLKGSSGYYTQNLIAGNSDRDVVNLFYGFLTGPENLQKKLTSEDGFTGKAGDTKEVKSKLQKAIHYIIGFEYDFAKHFELNVEGYHKNFLQLTNINRDKIFDVRETTRPEYLRTDYVVETGYAFGTDVILKYDYKHFYLWTTYSLGYLRRWDGRQEYAPIFDRRHNVNVVSSYTFGKGLKWQVDARWNLGSGFPFVPTSGQYESLQQQPLNTDPNSFNGTQGIQYGGLNEINRQPYYHRLDLSVKRTFEFNNDCKLETNFSLTNAYNRQNLFYYDRINRKRVDQLPLLPSIGITFSW